MDNLQTLCWRCNRGKRDKVEEYKGNSKTYSIEEVKEMMKSWDEE